MGLPLAGSNPSLFMQTNIGLAGPRLLTYLKDRKESNSIHELSEHVDPNAFVERFGAPLSDLDSLIESKAVSISKILQMIPEDISVTDPTPFLFNDTMYAMSCIMALCAGANFVLRRIGIPKLRNEMASEASESESEPSKDSKIPENPEDEAFPMKTTLTFGTTSKQ